MPGKTSRTGAEARAGGMAMIRAKAEAGKEGMGRGEGKAKQTGPRMESGDIGKGTRYMEMKMGRRARTGAEQVDDDGLSRQQTGVVLGGQCHATCSGNTVTGGRALLLSYPVEGYVLYRTPLGIRWKPCSLPDRNAFFTP